MIKKVDPKIDFVKLEHKLLEFWDKNGIFNKRVAANKGKPKWSFIDGPITANNPMGVHHAWGRSLKDIYLAGSNIFPIIIEFKYKYYLVHFDKRT